MDWDLRFYNCRRIFLFILWFAFALNGYSFKPYVKQDLIDNYELKSKEIQDLSFYIKSILDTNKLVDIEFENHTDLAIFHIKANNRDESNWDIKINSDKCDSLINALGWTKETLKTLKQKLEMQIVYQYEW